MQQVVNMVQLHPLLCQEVKYALVMQGVVTLVVVWCYIKCRVAYNVLSYTFLACIGFDLVWYVVFVGSCLSRLQYSECTTVLFF